MKLQKKFEEILLDEFHHLHNALPYDIDAYPTIYKARRACTKLCLEEQIKLLARICVSEVKVSNLFHELEKIQQQLKEFENEQI